MKVAEAEAGEECPWERQIGGLDNQNNGILSDPEGPASAFPLAPAIVTDNCAQEAPCPVRIHQCGDDHA